ncbi:MAG: hypothetical protein HYX72_05720 [Acidobacteria bacterium]|nr:hypothetical protein [Acidobacteriota bacterium]
MDFAIILACSTHATAQQARIASVSGAPDASLTVLEAAVQQLRADVDRSRREMEELRHQLQAARDEIATFRREFSGAPKQQSGEEPARSGTRVTQTIATQNQLAAEAERLPDVDHRIAALAEEQQLLSAKVQEQYQTKVESGSKYRVRVSGMALLNVFATRGPTDNIDVPTYALSGGTYSGDSFGASVRQSLFGLEVFGPRVGGAKSNGDVQFDFFGGFPNTPDGVTAGLVRMRTARIAFEWPHTSIVAGQDTPFFSPLSPTSLASTAYPALSAAGNLWVWTPQVRVEHRAALWENSSLLLQGGILDALTGEPPGYSYYRVPQAGERAGAPAYAARAAFTRAAFDRTFAAGAGLYFAKQDWDQGRTLNAWAATLDWDLPLGPWLSLRGEFYRGRGIGGLGGGGGRSVLFSGPPNLVSTSIVGLNTAGGWTQLKVKPVERLEFNGAFGEDYSFSSDLHRFGYSQSYLNVSLERNASAFWNVIYRARSNLLFSVEYRRLWTSELYSPERSAGHINFSAGILF